ncbi:MBL fold metallo-hydrolase [Paroceanicella profunda]|uniref:MBL fold metallo-hydrolase n=1 Tax=Paroceanicella profunda TaxID=2579971 RepID=A0A5B8FTG6_9RHOB|nr:MBL fold metallo-hydrolase [Paroceanicella profunda]QDL91645.1 MBL fold metallo-hydrolase [Paroceanicella profunda]
MTTRHETLSLLTRRDMLAGLAATLPFALPRGAFAADAAPHVTHGRFSVRVFSDGYLTLTGDILMPDADEEARQALLTRLKGNAVSAPVAANVPLIRAGDDLVLIDTGAGGYFQSSAGRLAQNLAAAGVMREAITKVVFTHAHPDHSGGTTLADGQLLFPNAQYYIARDEWDFWTDRNFASRRAPALHDFALGAQRDLFAVEDRLTRLLPGDEILPGMRITATPGHTPGHVSVELDGPEPLLIVGDACTSDIIFLENPGWRFGFDTDAELALATRKRLLDRAATERLQVLGYHWSHPGPGFIDRWKSAYRFVPA